MQAVASLQVSRPVAVVRQRSTAVIRATQVKEQAPKQQKAAIAGLVALAAAVMVAFPTPSHADVKTVVCASNPTSKLCLKDSAK